jgi:aspartate aminotransferase-like enzyme
VLFAAVQPVLRTVFGTSQPLRILTSSGTGAVEAGLRALPRGRLLSLVNGAFAERFAAIAEACGHAVERFAVRPGEVHDPEIVAARLRSGGHDAVTVVHSETSTGALQPLEALARATAGTPLLVDSVSGAGGVPLDFDGWGLAYCCTGSQKALALPPGLAFAVASPAFLARAEGAPDRGFYLDLRRYDADVPPFTPAIATVQALAVQCERIGAEGMGARTARHRAMAERCWAWVAATSARLGVGMEILAPAGARSPTVTCIRMPAGRDAPRFVRRTAEYGYTLGSGYGALKETTFRIGHMGDQTPETLEGLLDACEDALVDWSA